MSGTACAYGNITGECRLGFRRIAPVGKHWNVGNTVQLDTYPENIGAAYLRDLRLHLGIGIRDAHQRLGISPASYSELERGHFVCDWEAAYALLRKVSP